MPLNQGNTRVFHRCLYAGELKTIVLLKRNDDLQQGTVKALTLFECRRGPITKQGETIAGDMSSDHRATWHIPRTELDRQGVAYINALDRFVERGDAQPGSPAYGLVRYWQPESGEAIEVALFENYLHVDCQLVNPPPMSGTNVVQAPTPMQ